MIANRKLLAGASLLTLSIVMCGHNVQASPTAVVTLNTSNTIDNNGATPVTLTGSTNPVYSSGAGTTSVAPTITYAGATNAGMTIAGSFSGTSGNDALDISGNNAHGASDVTSYVTVTGTLGAATTGTAIKWNTSGQYNGLILSGTAVITSGTSGSGAAVVMGSTSGGFGVTNNGSISATNGDNAFQSSATNTAGASFTAASGSTTTASSSGNAIQFGAGANAYDASVTVSGGAVSQTGTASAIALSNVAASGDSVTVSSGSVSAAGASNAAIDVSGVTGAASTITVSGGTVSNGTGATGAAILVGQSGDAVHLNGGSVTGTIQTSTNGHGTVSFGAAGGFTTNGIIGTSSNKFSSVTVSSGTASIGNAMYANTIAFSGGTATESAGLYATSVNVNGGTVQSTASGTGAVDVSAGSGTTLALSSGAINNTAGATGLAVKLGNSSDAFNITGGTMTGTIQTGTNGNGSVSINASGGFTVGGVIGTSGNKLHSVTVAGGTATIGKAIYANTVAFSGGTTTESSGLYASNVNISGGSTTVQSTVSGTAAVDVSAGSGTTIALSSGTISNTTGITGTAVKLGNSADILNITGGTITGGILTSTNGNGSVTINDASGFTTHGALGLYNYSLNSVTVAGGTLTLGHTVTANNFNLNGGTTILSAPTVIVNAANINFGGSTLTLGTNQISTGAATLTTSTAASTINVTLGATANGQIVSSGVLTNSLTTGGQTVTINAALSGRTASFGDKYVILQGTSDTSGLALSGLSGNGNGLLASRWSLNGVSSGADAYGNAISGNSVVAQYNGTRDAHNYGATLSGGNAVNAGDSTQGPSQISTALLSLNSNADVAKAGAQLSGEGNRASIDGATASVIGTLNTVAGRLDDTRSVAHGGTGFSSGSDPHLMGVWMQGFGTAEVQGQREDTAGYKSSGAGLAVGADRLLNSNYRLGASFSYAHNGVNDTGVTNGNSTSIKSYTGTIYSSYNANPWYLDSALNFGVHRYDTTRVVNFTGFNDVALGSHTGYQYTAKVSGGYPFNMDSFVLTPIAGLAYSHLDQNAYTETSTNGAALNVGGVSNNSVKSSLGAKVATQYNYSSVRLIPETSATWEHEYINKALQSTDAYVSGGASFTSTNVHPLANTLDLGVGLTAKTTDDLSFVLHYDAKLGDSYVGHTGTLQARYDF